MFCLCHIVQVRPAVVKGEVVFVVCDESHRGPVDQSVEVGVAVFAFDACYFVGVPATA
ncbi:hypothetical protein ES703_78506 [subsurface metagenome]